MLTRTQRQLVREIEEIASMASMDHWNIEKYEEERRTSQLKMMKDQLVRSVIIMKYTLIDELLSNIICQKYFKHPRKGLWLQQTLANKGIQSFCPPHAG